MFMYTHGHYHTTHDNSLCIILEVTAVNKCIVDCLYSFRGVFFSVIRHICTHTRPLHNTHNRHHIHLSTLYAHHDQFCSIYICSNYICSNCCMYIYLSSVIHCAIVDYDFVDFSIFAKVFVFPENIWFC